MAFRWQGNAGFSQTDKGVGVLMSELCLEEIRINGFSYMCLLSKNHEGRHTVIRDWFVIKWGEVE